MKGHSQFSTGGRLHGRARPPEMLPDLGKAGQGSRVGTGFGISRVWSGVATSEPSAKKNAPPEGGAFPRYWGVSLWIMPSSTAA